MSITKQIFHQCQTDKLSELTIARSQLQGEVGGCLIIGSDQIVNLCDFIIREKYVDITGFFFESLNSSEILAELTNQNFWQKVKSFDTVIFSPSCHDIRSISESDWIGNKQKLEILFSNCHISIGDYLYSPKYICLGLVPKIKRMNKIIEEIDIPLLNFSSHYLDITSSDIPVPICEYFVEEDNNYKSKVTADSLLVIFSFLQDTDTFPPLTKPCHNLPSIPMKNCKVTRWKKVSKQRNFNSKTCNQATVIPTASPSQSFSVHEDICAVSQAGTTGYYGDIPSLDSSLIDGSTQTAGLGVTFLRSNLPSDESVSDDFHLPAAIAVSDRPVPLQLSGDCLAAVDDEVDHKSFHQV